MSISTGIKAPLFRLPAVENGDRKMISLTDYLGSFVILFFYPKDNTPFCTKENCLFRDNIALLALDAPNKSVLLGISPDSVNSHRLFARRNRLPFALLSDEDHRVVQAFDAWDGQRTDDETHENVLRKTFLIDPAGIVKRIYEVTDVEKHVFEVAQDLKVEEQIWKIKN